MAKWIITFILLLNIIKMNAQERLSVTPEKVAEPDMMVRIAEIDVVPEYLDAYKSILEAEAAASVKIEPGVICIFPMYEQKDSTQIKIIEIYASKAAYQSHLQTAHFLHYKSSTLKMIKSFRLVDMGAIDKEMMPEIFKKLNSKDLKP